MMEGQAKLLGLIGGGLAVAISAYTVVTSMHDKIQKVDELAVQIERQNEEIKQIKGNVIADEIRSEIKWLQRRMFHIEAEYGEALPEAPNLVREEYKQDRIELDNLQQELRTAQRAYRALR